MRRNVYLDLEIHKTQGLTLPNVTSTSQAYVATSRCPAWENLNILSLHRDAFIIDNSIIEEYQ